MIRPPRPDEVGLLPAIENAADRRYARVGLPRVLVMPPASVASVEQGRREGRLWIAAGSHGRAVGFAVMKLRAGHAWLDQLSVLDDWQGRGFGTALIDRTAHAARTLGYRGLYLSTYLGVPWNAAFYARRGFADVPRGQWDRVTRLQFTIENSHGHPSWRRTIMHRWL
jgi:GNAT superfamily N-acetyltransferase